jgi:hypothetical protein
LIQPLRYGDLVLFIFGVSKTTVIKAMDIEFFIWNFTKIMKPVILQQNDSVKKTKKIRGNKGASIFKYYKITYEF